MDASLFFVVVSVFLLRFRSTVGNLRPCYFRGETNIKVGIRGRKKRETKVNSSCLSYFLNSEGLNFLRRQFIFVVILFGDCYGLKLGSFSNYEIVLRGAGL